MTEQRLGEIAVLYIRHMIAQERATHGADFDPAQYLPSRNLHLAKICQSIDMPSKSVERFLRKMLGFERLDNKLLSKDEEGRIALAYLRQELARNGFSIDKETPKRIADRARALEISVRETTEAFHLFLRQVLDEMFLHWRDEGGASEAELQRAVNALHEETRKKALAMRH